MSNSVTSSSARAREQDLDGDVGRTEGLPYGWDGKDWRTYKWKMCTIFREHGLIDIVEKKALRKDVPEERRPAFDKREVKIMRMIGTTVPTDKLQQIDMYETGSDMWAALCELYEKRQNTAIRQSVIRRLVDELRDMRYEYTVHDVDMLELLLTSLPRQREYDLLRGTVQYGGGASHTPASLRELILEAAMRQERESSRGGKPDRKSIGTERQKGNVNDGEPIVSDGEWWCFDGGSNTHMVGNRDYFVSMEPIDSSGGNVHGLAQAMAIQAEGIGTVSLVTEVDGERVQVFVDDVLYVPTARHGLLSPGLAKEQAFEIAFDEATMEFTLSKDEQTVLRANLKQGTWGFRTGNPTERPKDESVIKRVMNYTAADGGMMLTQRQAKPCDACHVGKQRQKKRKQRLDRGLTAPNQIIYADLLCPSANNGTRKQASVVNALMRQFVLINAKLTQRLDHHTAMIMAMATMMGDVSDHGNARQGEHACNHTDPTGSLRESEDAEEEPTTVDGDVKVRRIGAHDQIGETHDKGTRKRQERDGTPSENQHNELGTHVQHAEKKIERENLTDTEKKDFDVKEIKIMRLVGTAIPTARLQQVDKHYTGSDMWSALCEIYEKRQNPMIKQSVILRLQDEIKILTCSGSGDVEIYV
ncbi:TPA: hypothetical protein N0F65_000218 [Lagenidium giganteum]|uniref:Retrovirus-related Pol polyprotein from transposon TNT 1-94-like beta-barrel domain-containing protein n=1 Tax=Lagenidium giganteum TaxID=4803 RepID=A0AAV2YH90_9STRA|nr:TPA: hypothetical protein N0F65_000218 [Lagenidium giganteum]